MKRRLIGRLASSLLLSVLIGSTGLSAAPLTISHQTITDYRALDGTVEAVNQSTVSAQVQAVVTGIYADVGDQIDAGTLLVKLDDTEIQAKLRQAQAAVAEAKANLFDTRSQLQRLKQLFTRKATSQSDLDRAQAAYDAAVAQQEAARSEVAVAQRQLSYTQIKAPYSGLVVARQVELGETVQPGTPLLTGLALSPLRVLVQVPQSLKAIAVKDGKVQIDYDGTPLATANISRVSPLASQDTHDFAVRIDLPADIRGPLPGEAVKVRFITGERQAILIPQASVVHEGELSAVYVMDNQDQPLLRQVRLGATADNQVEVLAGLKDGERIAPNAVDILSELAKKAVSNGR